MPKRVPSTSQSRNMSVHSSPLHFPHISLTSRTESPECDVTWEGSKEKGNQRKKQLKLGQCLVSVELWDSHIMHLKEINLYETVRKPHPSAHGMASQYSTSHAIPDQLSAPVVRTKRNRRSPCRPKKDFMAQAGDQTHGGNEKQNKWKALYAGIDDLSWEYLTGAFYSTHLPLIHHQFIVWNVMLYLDIEEPEWTWYEPCHCSPIAQWKHTYTAPMTAATWELSRRFRRNGRLACIRICISVHRVILYNKVYFVKTP